MKKAFTKTIEYREAKFAVAVYLNNSGTRINAGNMPHQIDVAAYDNLMYYTTKYTDSENLERDIDMQIDIAKGFIDDQLERGPDPDEQLLLDKGFV